MLRSSEASSTAGDHNLIEQTNQALVNKPPDAAQQRGAASPPATM